MLSPRRTSRGLLADLVARVLIVVLVLGPVPALPTEASISTPERPLPLSALLLAERKRTDHLSNTSG